MREFLKRQNKKTAGLFLFVFFFFVGIFPNQTAQAQTPLFGAGPNTVGAGPNAEKAISSSQQSFSALSDLYSAGKDFASFLSNPSIAITKSLLAIGNFAIEIMAVAVFVAAQLFDLAMHYCVVGFYNIGNSNAVTTAWQLVRDMCNLSFIYIIVFLGIQTILDNSTAKTKSALIWLIIGAVFINFSAFFAKIVIDIPNAVSVGFYQQLVLAGKTTGGTNTTNAIQGFAISGKVQDTTGNATAISGLIANAMGLQTLMNPNSVKAVDQKTIDTANVSNSGIVIRMFASIAFMFVAMLVFFTSAILLFTRGITLIFVIILAPFGIFLAGFPSAEKMAKKWRDALFQNALFPAVYMFGLYITIQFSFSISKILGTGATTQSGTIADGFLGGNMSLMFGYVIAVAMLYASLYIAKSTGVAGAAFADKWGGILTGKTIGAVGTITGLSYASDRVRTGTENTGRALRTRIDKFTGTNADRLLNFPVFGGALGRGLRGAGNVAVGVGNTVGQAATNAVTAPLSTLGSLTAAATGAATGKEFRIPGLSTLPEVTQQEKDATTAALKAIKEDRSENGMREFNLLTGRQQELVLRSMNGDEQLSLYDKALKSSDSLGAKLIMDTRGRIRAELTPAEQKKFDEPETTRNIKNIQKATNSAEAFAKLDENQRKNVLEKATIPQRMAILANARTIAGSNPTVSKLAENEIVKYNKTISEVEEKGKVSAAMVDANIGRIKKGGLAVFNTLSGDEQKAAFNKMAPAERVKLIEDAEKTNDTAAKDALNGYLKGLDAEEAEKMKVPLGGLEKRKEISGIINDIKKAQDPSEMNDLRKMLKSMDKNVRIEYTITDIEKNPKILEIMNSTDISKIIRSNQNEKATIDKLHKIIYDHAFSNTDHTTDFTNTMNELQDERQPISKWFKRYGTPQP
jgi:hypothetical protein